MHKFIPSPCDVVFVFSKWVKCGVVKSVVIHELLAIANEGVESMRDVGVVSSLDGSAENKIQHVFIRQLSGQYSGQLL